MFQNVSMACVPEVKLVSVTRALILELQPLQPQLQPLQPRLQPLQPHQVIVDEQNSKNCFNNIKIVHDERHIYVNFFSFIACYKQENFLKAEKLFFRKNVLEYKKRVNSKITTARCDFCY